MSRRRGAPSVDPECVIRRKWFEEAQRREFRGEDEDDDEEEDDIEEEGQQQEEEEVFAEKDRQEGRSPSPSSRAVSRSKSRTPSRPGTRYSVLSLHHCICFSSASEKTLFMKVALLVISAVVSCNEMYI